VDTLQHLTLTIVMAPLIACLIAGLFRHQIGKKGAHTVTILGVGISFVLSLLICKHIFIDGVKPFNGNLYIWAAADVTGGYQFTIGFLIDRLSAVMITIVSFVSLLVHIYSIGYMADDDGYQRFFSYISLFTFAMLMLVTANNFLQLFFGWEGVGLVSYLLIGFWYERESAIFGSLKAFLVNRVGDFGFILGIALVLAYAGSLNYQSVFAQAQHLSTIKISLFPGSHWSVVTCICILLFVGAMGKSAQVPLHVWLPESMEGPTPISALIHAATMVTAGVFMVARMSPLFEHSEMALSLVMVLGGTGALFMGIVAVVQTDIKRVVAYSTLSQLGYMMVAQGASAYGVGIFHLLTHACFKALLFLGAGSVIIAMHHEQDMRNMGGLYKYMPITYITVLIGSFSLSAIPPFSGFFSKDMIIEAAHLASIPGAHYAYWCVALGAFVTALYTFRALFMTFHGEERFSSDIQKHIKESPWVVTLPLIGLAIPSVAAGWWLIDAVLAPHHGLFGSSITIAPHFDVMQSLRKGFAGPFEMVAHAYSDLPFWLSLAGLATAWLCYNRITSLPAYFAKRFSIVYAIIVRKFGFDDFNQVVLVRGTRAVGQGLYQYSDRRLIDDTIVNGVGKLVRVMSAGMRQLQSGYLYHYAMVMVLGLLAFLYWLIMG